MGASTTRMRFRRSGAVFVSLGLILGLIGMFGGASSAASGLDFAAAEPSTYDHTAPPDNATATFGYGDGSNHFVVEQLEGGDYDCNEVVPFFTRVDLGGDESVELMYTFDRFTTGHKDGTPGVGYRDVVGVTASTSDTAHTATNATLSWGESSDGAHTYATATVSGLENGDVFIVRVDVRIGCDAGADPKDSTGNLLAHLDADVPGGAQTVPMKSAATIIVPPSEASLTIVKDAVPNAAQNFTFHLSTTETAFVLDDASPDDGDAYTDRTEPLVLAPATYTITESAVAGWTFTGAACNDETSPSVTPTITVTLSAGENVTCTFTNTKAPDGTTTTSPPPPPPPPPDVTTTVPPTTTTTTLPPTTTTQAPTTTAAPTTTIAAVAVLGEQLARTGSTTALLLWLAVLLLITGSALLALGEKKVGTAGDRR